MESSGVPEDNCRVGASACACCLWFVALLLFRGSWSSCVFVRSTVVAFGGAAFHLARIPSWFSCLHCVGLQHFGEWEGLSEQRALGCFRFPRMRLRLLYLCLCAWPPCCRSIVGVVVFRDLLGSRRARTSRGITVEGQRPPAVRAVVQSLLVLSLRRSDQTHFSSVFMLTQYEATAPASPIEALTTAAGNKAGVHAILDSGLQRG